jgi:hypothetical protein
MGGGGDEHLRIEVLDAEGAVIASFASAIEAYRYAALVADPHFKPKLRRISDGAIRTFKSADRPADLEAWGKH